MAACGVMASDGMGPKAAGVGIELEPEISEEFRDDAGASVIEITGSIKWFDVAKGFGFIVPDNGMPDVLHAGDLGYRYWRNLGSGKLDLPQTIDMVPAGLSLARAGVGFGDTDGDGDPHTTHTTDHIARDQVALPELEDMVAALHHCQGPVCTSDEREFHFGWKPGPGGDLVLAKIEVIERPPCRSP